MNGSIVLAPDKFKGSLDAPGVAAALAAGIADADPSLPVVQVPVADGGEGTVAAALAAGWDPVTVDATGPTGAPLRVIYARHGTSALVELAAVAGLGVLPGGEAAPGTAGPPGPPSAAPGPDAEGTRGPGGGGRAPGAADARGPAGPPARVLAPGTASTRGLGTVVAHALDAGAREIVIGVGGSASTDGGAGLLAGLGARMLDDAGAELQDGGAALIRAHRLDLSGLHPAAREARFTTACDVDNPLLGPHGAAAVYGPQKGATPAQVSELDAALARWADVLAAATGTDARHEPGSGAAGGVPLAAIAALGAVRRSGVGTVLELVGFDEALACAALVVTGEGRLDVQTLHGKAPAGVAAAARAAGIPVVAVAGDCTLDGRTLHEAGFAAVHTLLGTAPDRDTAFTRAPALLRRIGARIATQLPAHPARTERSCDPAAPTEPSSDQGSRAPAARTERSPGPAAPTEPSSDQGSRDPAARAEPSPGLSALTDLSHHSAAQHRSGPAPRAERSSEPAARTERPSQLAAPTDLSPTPRPSTRPAPPRERSVRPTPTPPSTPRLGAR